MSMSDPIADMFSRIGNAQQRRKKEVSMPYSKTKAGIAEVLKDEGYIADLAKSSDGPHDNLVLKLKYFQGQPVIQSMERYSRPGLRHYRGKSDIPKVMGGLGVAIMSTSGGIMTDHAARNAGHGGEVLAFIT